MSPRKNSKANVKPVLEAKPLYHSVTESALSGPHWSQRTRVQLPVLLVVVFGLQLVVLFFTKGASPLDQQALVSIVATQMANMIAAISYRNVRRVPGTRKLGFILPTLTASYAVLILAAFVFRIPYSIWLTATGYAGAMIVLWVLNSRGRLAPNGGLHVVNSPQIAELVRDLPRLNFNILESPVDLARLNDGAVIVDLREDLSQDWERAIARAVLRSVPVFHVKQAYESLTGKVRFDHLSENHLGSLVPSIGYFAVKRIIDIVGSIVALIILALPMTIIALLIRATSTGPAIFRHVRIGFRGEPFKTLKFRTMAQRDHDDDDLQSQITVNNDPRITSIGRFLRGTRCDEFPQIFNVLMGQMSFIGPRPEALALSEWYYERLDFYEYRHIVRPGITGWAQVNQGHVTSIEDIFDKTQYDFYYIKNVSLWLDFLIAIKTIEIMISGRGAR